MSDTHSSGAHAAHEAHHTNYVKIYFILVFLLIVSVAGPFLGNFYLTLLTAFGVAFVKAGLVATKFMHVGQEKPFMWYALGASLAFMVLFFAAVSPDVMKHEGRRWDNVAAKAEVERREAAHKAEEAGGGEHGGAEHGEAPEGAHP